MQIPRPTGNSKKGLFSFIQLEAVRKSLRKEAASGLELGKLNEVCFTLREECEAKQESRKAPHERHSILAGKWKGGSKLGQFLWPDL